MAHLAASYVCHAFSVVMAVSPIMLVADLACLLTCSEGCLLAQKALRAELAQMALLAELGQTELLAEA